MRRHVERPGQALCPQPGEERSKLVGRGGPVVQPAVDVGLVAAGQVDAVDGEVAEEVMGDLEATSGAVGPVLAGRLGSGLVA